MNSETSINDKDKLTWTEYLDTLKLYNSGDTISALQMYNSLKHKKIAKGTTLYDWAIILKNDLLNCMDSPFTCSKESLSGMH